MKKLLIVFSALALVVTLAACKPVEEVPEDLVVTLSGLADQEITAGDTIDLLDGVTAMGSDDMDYTDVINVDSDDCVVTEGTIDTSNPATCHITYTAVVEGKMTRETIVVTIKPVEVGPVEGPILAEWHWDTDADLEGWTKYEAGGGTVADSVEDGALKLVTTSGGAVYETRYEFMGLPWEDGQAYEISFKAKSDIDGKGIHFQVGELISSDPWFWDFKPGQVDDFKLSLDWQEFSFSFIYNKASDSGFGGPLLEMGNFENTDAGISSIGLDATIWIDDLVIKGGSGEDTQAPEITGAEDTTLFIGDVTEFDPLAGVMAMDYPDVDLTDRIILSGDTVDVNTAGVYMLFYVVLDDAFNQDRVARIVTVQEDTEGPVFSGVEEVTYFVGDGKDPLTGVMAMDNRDGDVTADIVLSGDTWDAAVEGTYNITYTVEDALGNSTTVDRVIELLDVTFVDYTSNLVNPNFDAGYWHPYWEEWNGADAFIEATDDGLVLDIKAVGGDFWHVLIEQEGIVLEANKTYRLSFDAMSTVARDIQAEIAGAQADGVSLITIDGEEWQATVSLTDTMTTYTLDIVVGDTATGGTLKFLMGLINDAAASVITLDNVMLEEWDGTAVVTDTDQVMDGSFDEWQTTGWGVWSPNGNTSFQTQWKEGYVYYDEANANPWENKLEQLNIPMEAGLVYRVTFDAKGDAARDFIVGFWDGGTAFEKQLELGTDFQTYTWIFTYTGGANAALEFKLGQSSDNYAGTLFVVDNIMIEKEDAVPAGPTTLDMMPNQDFTDTDISGWGVEGTPVLSHDAAGYLVASVSELGSNPWDHNMGFPNLTVLAGKTYTVTFVAKTGFVEGRDVTFFAEDTNNGYSKYFEEVASLTDTFQTFTYEFAVMTDNEDTKLGAFLGNTSNPFVGDVVFDSITITVADTPAPTQTLADLANQDFTDADLTAWAFGDGTGTITHDAMGYLIASPDPIGGNPWEPNLGTVGHNVLAGKTYTVTYVVRTDVVGGRDVTFFAEDTNNGYAKYFEQTETLTDTFQTFTYTFAVTVNNDDTKLGAFLGNVNGAGLGAVIFDSITVTEVDTPVT